MEYKAISYIIVQYNEKDIGYNKIFKNIYSDASARPVKVHT